MEQKVRYLDHEAEKKVSEIQEAAKRVLEGDID